MAFVKQFAGMTALGVAMLFGTGLCASEAQAAYTVTLTQQGPNVVATGSGTIDLTGLTSEPGGSSTAGLVPNEANINTGPVSIEARDSYSGFTGPTSFGSGGTTFASSGSGDIVGIAVDGENIVKVPSGYVSGASLSDTSTYDSATFASLGVTPGTYVWTWGPVAADDSFTLDIVAPAAVPEPSSLALLALPLGLVILLAARRRRAARSA